MTTAQRENQLAVESPICSAFPVRLNRAAAWASRAAACAQPLYGETVQPPPFNRQAEQWVKQQWKWQQIITWSNTGNTFKSMKSFAGLLCATATTSPLPLSLKSSKWLHWPDQLCHRAEVSPASHRQTQQLLERKKGGGETMVNSTLHVFH